jgi:hypothetical protein
MRALLALPQTGRKELADALRTELLNGPNATAEIKFDAYGSAYSDSDEGKGEAFYTATPISFRGSTVVHRQMTTEELRRLRQEQGRSTARRGIYVIDILSAESAFRRPTAGRV